MVREAQVDFIVFERMSLHFYRQPEKTEWIPNTLIHFLPIEPQTQPEKKPIQLTVFL